MGANLRPFSLSFKSRMRIPVESGQHSGEFGQCPMREK